MPLHRLLDIAMPLFLLLETNLGASGRAVGHCRWTPASLHQRGPLARLGLVLSPNPLLRMPFHSFWSASAMGKACLIRIGIQVA